MRTLEAPFILICLILTTSCAGATPGETAIPSVPPSPPVAVAPEMQPGVTGVPVGSPSLTPSPTTAPAPPESSPSPGAAAPSAEMEFPPAGSPAPAPTQVLPVAGPGSPITPTPSANAVLLGLGGISGPPSPGRELSLSIQLDPKGRGVSGVQFQLRATREEVRVLGVDSAGLLGLDAVEIKGPGDEPGAFAYAASRRGRTLPPTPAGRLATVKLWVAEGAKAGTGIDIALERVKIADENFLGVDDLAVGPTPTLLVVEP